MKTRFNDINCNWKLVKNHCRTTDNKDFTEKEASDEFKRKLLISEHSPIRLITVDWSWEDIESWVATHWSRHKWECFISTQRDDRKQNPVPRRELPQGQLVNFDGNANIQSLIDTFRKRLCVGQVSPETYELAVDFKMALHEVYPELADVLVPNCIYRFGCPEFKSCAMCHKLFAKAAYEYYENHLGDDASYEDLMDLQWRYDVYNKWIYDDGGRLKALAIH